MPRKFLLVCFVMFLSLSSNADIIFDSGDQYPKLYCKEMTWCFSTSPDEIKIALEEKGYVGVVCSLSNTAGFQYGIKCFGEYAQQIDKNETNACQVISKKLKGESSAETITILGDLLTKLNC